MIAGTGETGGARLAELVLTRRRQHSLHIEPGRREEHVVEGLADFSRPAANLPGGVVGLGAGGLLVGRGQVGLTVLGQSRVDRLGGLGVEVAADDHWAVAGVGVDEGEQVLALLAADGAEQGAGAGLEVCGDGTQLLAGVSVTQDGQNHHLREGTESAERLPTSRVRTLW